MPSRTFAECWQRAEDQNQRGDVGAHSPANVSALPSCDKEGTMSAAPFAACAPLDRARRHGRLPRLRQTRRITQPRKHPHLPEPGRCGAPSSLLESWRGGLGTPHLVPNLEIFRPRCSIRAIHCYIRLELNGIVLSSGNPGSDAAVNVGFKLNPRSDLTKN